MSGFGYHLECVQCQLVSRVYPYRFSYTGSDTLVLPVSASADARFGEVEAVMDRRSSDVVLAQLARERSTPERPVSLPFLRDQGVVLEPELRCPRCASAIRAVLGRPAPTELEASGLDQLVVATRSTPEGRAIRMPLDDGFVVQCQRRDGSEAHATWEWEILHRKGANPLPILQALSTHLSARGSVVDEPCCLRRCCSFTERADRVREVPPAPIRYPEFTSMTAEDLFEKLMCECVSGCADERAIRRVAHVFHIYRFRVCPGLDLEDGGPDDPVSGRLFYPLTHNSIAGALSAGWVSTEPRGTSAYWKEAYGAEVPYEAVDDIPDELRPLATEARARVLAHPFIMELIPDD